MVIVYFANGNGTAEVKGATKVETKKEQDLPGAALGVSVPALVCLDDRGQELGKFRWDQIIGYSILK